MIMSTEEIKEGLAFTRKYIRKLAVVDEVTAQQLTAINKSQKDVIIYVLSLISKQVALLGKNLRKKRAKRFQGTTVNR